MGSLSKRINEIMLPMEEFWFAIGLRGRHGVIIGSMIIDYDLYSNWSQTKSVLITIRASEHDA